MSLAERCDQIARLIDDALSEIPPKADVSTDAEDARDEAPGRHCWRRGPHGVQDEGGHAAA